MAVSEERALEILNEVAKQAELDTKISAVVYREDYQDYIVVVGKIHFTDVREKLITAYDEVGPDMDIINEIGFKLKHPAELEDWQIEEMGLGDEITEEDLARERNKDGKGGATREELDEASKKNIAVDKSEETEWLKD